MLSTAIMSFFESRADKEQSDRYKRIRLSIMAYLHYRTRTRIRTPNPMATSYCTETVPIAQIHTGTQIPI